jgi:hypothetical protein
MIREAPMKKKCFTVVFVLIILMGCATTLPKVPITSLNDDELLRYYYSLNDNIAAKDRLESGYRNTESIFSLNSAIAKSDGDDLRKERINATMELRKRGISP